MKNIFTFFLFSFSLGLIWGQNAPGKTQISGTVLDGSNQNPLEYAAIRIAKLSDSSVVAGGVTDSKGTFQIAVSAGSYLVEVSYLSYEKKQISPVEVSRSRPHAKLGNIQVTESAVTLDAVEMTAQRSQLSMDLDKRVYTVDADIANTGSNASEILENVPSVTVDIEGNVALRGSQNVRILIDGKPSGMVGISSADALRNMQGSMIERVEVITNPSARYDAEGEAGIINIVLKKNKRRGVNGSFDLTVGEPDNYRAAYNLNFRREKFNFFSNFGFNYRNRPGRSTFFQVFEDENGLFNSYRSNNDRIRGGYSGNLQLGLDYYFDKYNSITVSGLYQAGDGENTSKITYEDFDQNEELINLELRDNTEREIEHNIESSLSYRRTFPQKGREWTTDVKYIVSDETELAKYLQTGGSGNTLLNQESDNTEDQTNWFFQTDYVHPLGKNGKFETGSRITLRSITNAYQVREEGPDGIFEVLSDFDDELRYQENVYAAYAIYGNKWQKLSYQVGLRAEYSTITTELVKSNQRNPRDFMNVFPSLHLSYEASAQNQFQLSYSRRISRPRFRNLLSFPTFEDTRNLYQGNPDLNPTFTDSYEAGYLRYWEKGSLLSSVYYRRRTGVVERIIEVDEDGFTRRFPINLSVENAVGIEFNGNYSPTKWWQLTLNANFYRAVRRGEYEGVRYDADTYTMTSRFSTKMTILNDLDIQTSFNYRAPRVTTQGRNLAIYSWDMGAAKDILKGKGTLTFSVRDLLNSRRWRAIVEGDGFYSELDFQWRVRQFMLSFNYRLNQNKKRRRGGRGGGGFDEGDF
ncbi:MAG: TonB-dependent receptor [Bacteroidota bacterium]